ncbi:hypothetical protein [Metallosphaera hakonensis]|uniref:Uncharacterized protein n=1 Tax=Metallosphaera hakonensis JCM 8857 = DSM 7519 TaxID=1293036 RepID=A0A2U9ITQ4_9CREN|nr:hypothetical protein [Metallosphaera hakonensis]AWR99362.1 hypothetical protein DFR87_06190 [Metallosphaera hakonensis JCM 8857 = DSM 7519]
MKRLPILMATLRILGILAIFIAPFSVHGMIPAPPGGGGPGTTWYAYEVVNKNTGVDEMIVNVTITVTQISSTEYQVSNVVITLTYKDSAEVVNTAKSYKILYQDTANPEVLVIANVTYIVPYVSTDIYNSTALIQPLLVNGNLNASHISTVYVNGVPETTTHEVNGVTLPAGSLVVVQIQ